MDAPVILGGEEEGTPRNPNWLRPSELRYLRENAESFYFTPDDCKDAVKAVMGAIREGENWRTRIGGVNAMAVLKRINLAEVEQMMAGGKGTPITNNTQVNIHLEQPPAITEQGRVSQALALLDVARARAISGPNGGATVPAEELRPSQADGEAIGVPEAGMP